MFEEIMELKHQTITQFANRIKKRWDESSRYDRARLAAWLYKKYNTGEITQAQIRTVFGLDTTQKWEAFRDRILALYNQYLAIQAEE